MKVKKKDLILPPDGRLGFLVFKKSPPLKISIPWLGRRRACATAFRNLGPFGACVFTSFHDYLDVHKTSIKLVADKTH